MCESREMAATPSGVGGHENQKYSLIARFTIADILSQLVFVAAAFPVILSECVPIAFDLFSTAANFFSILGNLCVASTALDVAAQLLAVSVKLFGIAVQLPAITPDLSIILLQFF